jgi:hypothetical protein
VPQELQLQVLGGRRLRVIAVDLCNMILSLSIFTASRSIVSSLKECLPVVLLCILSSSNRPSTAASTPAVYINGNYQLLASGMARGGQHLWPCFPWARSWIDTRMDGLPLSYPPIALLLLPLNYRPPNVCMLVCSKAMGIIFAQVSSRVCPFDLPNLCDRPDPSTQPSAHAQKPEAHLPW